MCLLDSNVASSSIPMSFLILPRSSRQKQVDIITHIFWEKIKNWATNSLSFLSIKIPKLPPKRVTIELETTPYVETRKMLLYCVTAERNKIRQNSHAVCEPIAKA
mmetsp:Transcript_37385/g.43523  ORF Transcript_37385/g.43523 Transcript_37385/m.43523 type:complete len:105 (-) Transcript_37385:282-596(-)